VEGWRRGVDKEVRPKMVHFEPDRRAVKGILGILWYIERRRGDFAGFD
jgi:hypothetical protein